MAKPSRPDAAPAAHQFGAALRSWRQQRSLSQLQLAFRITYSKETIAKVELGERWPVKDFAESCDAVLDTEGELAALFPEVEAERRAHDGRQRRHRSTHAAQPRPTDAERALREALHTAAGAATPTGVIAAADEVRQMLDELLDDGTGPAIRLDRLEANVAQHARDALTVAPAEMVYRLSLDIIDARHVARTRRRTTDRQRLRAVLARLAALNADELSVIGDTHASRAWHATAAAAADTTADPALRADVRTLAALLPLYHGAPTWPATRSRTRDAPTTAPAPPSRPSRYSGTRHGGTCSTKAGCSLSWRTTPPRGRRTARPSTCTRPTSSATRP